MLGSLRQAVRRVRGAARPTPEPGPGQWWSRDQAIMGTAIRVELWCEDGERAQRAIDAVMREMEHVDEAMSPYKEHSELSLVNREAARRAVRVSAELFDLLDRSLDFSRESGGAFDITYAAVGHLYDYRRRVRPSDDERKSACAAVGYRNLQLDPAQRTVRFARPGVRIDLGGFAKGYAVDRGAQILREHGIANAIVTAGGDSRVLGDRHGRPWMVGIADPRQRGKMVAVLPLADVAISTSGDYERYFEEGGERYHHVIDPRTGESPAALQSVTIVAPDGLTAEGLSKSVFVLGLAPGMSLVEARPGVDAVVVDAAGVLHYSSGLRRGGADMGAGR